jgi:transposase
MLVRWFPQRVAVGKLLFHTLSIDHYVRRKLMTTAAPHHEPENTKEATLFVAFELSEKTWKLGFTTGHGQKPRERTVTARQQERVLDEIVQAKRRLGLPDTATVVSCYEAGREGFWLHRFLQGHGITNQVVDSSAIEVNRRRRRAKSDGLDVRKLLSMLMRYHHGERQVWQVVKSPSVEAEDQRHLHRDLETLKQERASTMTRIEGLLSSQGLRVPSLSKLPEQLDALRLWDGSPLPPGLRRRVLRVYAQYTFLSEQIAAVEAERRALLQTSPEASIDKVRQLRQLKGIGINGAWLLVMEFFGWRAFKNRREVGALAGFTPTPYQSGESAREQGITKSGNRHVRWMTTELAWSWVRFQPDSALSCWFRERFGGGGKRLRRIGIVAVARKLLIALWRFLETGVLPVGAELKEG